MIKLTHDNEKMSYEDYAEKGIISCKKERLFDFSGGSVISEYSNKTETFNGESCFSVSFDKDIFQARVLETTDTAFSFGVKDRRRETVKILMYVNDIDLLACDHDMVYDHPQKNFGTLWISFGKSSEERYKYCIQHTFKGSGWHMLEIAFNTDNIIYNDRINLDFSEFHYMSIRGNVKPGLVMKFVNMDKAEYSNDGYTAPKCPRNGRWLSCCDCASLDGAIITEWVGSSFDFENRLQADSVLSITGHKEHVDYRCVWGGLDVPISEDDIFHTDMYISDVNAVGRGFAARIAQDENGPGSAMYSFGYDVISKFANGGQGLKNGWNEIDVPVSEMRKSVDENYFTEPFELRIEHIMFFWAGASPEKEYTVKYGGMYLYKKTDK